MKQRFIDCDMWEDEWFLGLPTLYKLFWVYIFSRCDVVGVWKPAYRMAGIVLGSDISEHQALELFNAGKERIAVLPNGSWWIKGFIPFQYKKLKYTCNPHLAVIRQAEQYGLDITEHISQEIKGSGRVAVDYRKGSPTLQDKDKDSSLSSPSSMYAFNELWLKYPSSRRGNRAEAIEAWNTESPPKWALDALSIVIKSDAWTKDNGQYIPGMAKWIRNHGWDMALDTHSIVYCIECNEEGITTRAKANMGLRCKKCNEIFKKNNPTVAVEAK